MFLLETEDSGSFLSTMIPCDAVDSKEPVSDNNSDSDQGRTPEQEVVSPSDKAQAHAAQGDSMGPHEQHAVSLVDRFRQLLCIVPVIRPR